MPKNCFWGLYIAGFQVQIAASVRLLMINAFTVGVMWQALSSRDNAVELKHIFSCNMAADVIFLCSWKIQNGGVTVLMIAGTVFFALQSAALSVLLEWFYPIRGWKIESDLWHHPRKYVFPVVMLLLA